MLKDILSFDKATKYFLLSTVMMGLSNGLFDSVYNFYLEENGVNKVDTGNIYAFAMFVMSISVIPLIFFNNRFPTKNILIISSFLYSIPFVALPMTTDVLSSSIILACILSGMIALLSSGNALFGAHVKKDMKTTFFSAFFISYLGAAMIGSFIVAGIIKYSTANDNVNYKIILTISFILSLVMIIFRFYSIKGIDDLPKKNKNEIKLNNIEWKNFIALFISSFLLGASITLVFRFANIIFSQAYSLDISDISLVLGFDKIVSILGAIFAPLIVKRLQLKKTLLTIGALVFITLYSQSLEITLSIFILLYFARLLLNYALMPLLDTLAITGFDSSRTLISTSIRQLSFYLGSAVSAVIYGHLLNDGNWKYSLILSGILALIGSIFLLMIEEKKNDILNVQTSVVESK
ncbi:MFS transporter [Vibrio sp. V12_P9A6T4]|uniref:MFS transporter n=1 Tax=Vibrio sp. V12_P9A6T4 TaxID=1938667 RepID=UPI000B8EE190|nr:MFS transporter [Vibrio sp. V12_P9A6T4]OXX51474.1 MFS transporter [Vibrio sp. V12_P9A6T4]